MIEKVKGLLYVSALGDVLRESIHIGSVSPKAGGIEVAFQEFDLLFFEKFGGSGIRCVVSSLHTASVKIFHLCRATLCAWLVGFPHLSPVSSSDDASSVFV